MTYEDNWGNPACGEDFMAGTICSDRPGHEGAHSATCQNCSGDWVNGTCTCWCCEFCEEDKGAADRMHEYEIEADEYTYWICDECLESSEGPSQPSAEDMDYVMASLGVSQSEH